MRGDCLPFTAILKDVRTVIHLARSGIVLTLLLLVSVAGNFYQYYRRPDRIIVDKSSGRVVEINDRDYGETEAVQLGPEHLTDADKKYIASEFVRSLYQIDPATRSKDIERALRMMLPDSALKSARYLKQDNIGCRQQAPKDTQFERISDLQRVQCRPGQWHARPRQVSFCQWCISVQ